MEALVLGDYVDNGVFWRTFHNECHLRENHDGKVVLYVLKAVINGKFFCVAKILNTGSRGSTQCEINV